MNEPAQYRIASVRETDPPLYELEMIGEGSDQPLAPGTVLDVASETADCEATNG